MFDFFSVFVTQFESTPSRKEQNPLFLEIAQIELASFWQGQKIKANVQLWQFWAGPYTPPSNFLGAKAVAHTVAQLYRVFCVGKSCL
jgi:hypothetical protein